jgi:hypothetical protein
MIDLVVILAKGLVGEHGAENSWISSANKDNHLER